MFEKRINIFIGHFGSGKTEVAVNYALQMSKYKKDITVLDFDIVNPYFRAADARVLLNNNEISTIIPMYANSNVDIPALTGEVNKIFEDEKINAILDVGGDDLGAKAVSCYREKIMECDYDLFFVVNVNRPMTDTVDKIVEMYNEIIASAGIVPTALINNTHAMQYTTLDMIVEAQKMVEQAAEIIGIPVKIISGMEETLNGFTSPEGIELLKMNKCIHLPF